MPRQAALPTKAGQSKKTTIRSDRWHTLVSQLVTGATLPLAKFDREEVTLSAMVALYPVPGSWKAVVQHLSKQAASYAAPEHISLPLQQCTGQ